MTVSRNSSSIVPSSVFVSVKCLLSKFLMCFLLTASYFSSPHHQASVDNTLNSHCYFTTQPTSVLSPLFLLFETIFSCNFQVSPLSHLVAFSFLCLLSFLSEAVHHPSVRVNASHSSLFCVETWGTDLKFSWLHERAAIADAVGHVSADGKTLFISSAPICGHFTCMVSNKLGHSSATYTAGMEPHALTNPICLSCLIHTTGPNRAKLHWHGLVTHPPYCF